MTEVTVRILSGRLSKVEADINTALRDGWHLMGPATYAGNRRIGGDPAYPISQVLTAFYTATIWKQQEIEDGNADE